MLTELLLFPLAALAQETPCAYDLAQLDADLAESERFSSQWEPAKAVESVEDARERMPCLTVPIPPEVLGRFARQSALLAFLDQDEDAATMWSALAVSTGPLQWPSELDLPPGFPPFVDRVPVPQKRLLENKGLVVPDKGAIQIGRAHV